MKFLFRAVAMAFSPFLFAAAQAQHASESWAPSGKAPEMAAVTVPALSTPQQGSATSTNAAATSGNVAFSGGAATFGPFLPQLGRAAWLLLRGTSASFSVVLGTSIDGCATFYPLTAGGQPITYTTPINEIVDVPTRGTAVRSDNSTEQAPGICGKVTVADAGTLFWSLRQ